MLCVPERSAAFEKDADFGNQVFQVPKYFESETQAD